MEVEVEVMTNVLDSRESVPPPYVPGQAKDRKQNSRPIEFRQGFFTYS